MKIILQTDDDYEEVKVEVIFTDDSMDNSNYVEMRIREKSYTVSIEDLYRVVKLFNEKRLESK